MNIANQGFPATRADLNNALQALVSNSSGTSAPSTTFANQWWYDTTNNKLYIRNEANNAWIQVAVLDQTNNEWQITTGQISASDGDGLVFKTDDGNTRITLSDGGDVTFADGTDVITASAGTDNVRIGQGAGDSIASGGNNNVVIGKDAGTAITTGSYNTALGQEALSTNTTANYGTAVGYQALQDSTGTLNTAVGAFAAHNNTTGVENTVLGAVAFEDNTSGSYNTAIGRQALTNNTTASNNTAVGYQAGYSNTTSGDNTFVGWQAGYSRTGTGNTIVGQYAGRDGTTGVDNTFIGRNSGYTITTGSNNTILGMYNGNQGGLDIRTSSNNIVLSDGDGVPLGYRKSSDGTWVFDNATNAQNGVTVRNTGTGGNPYALGLNYPNVAPNNDAGRFLTCSDSSSIRLKIFNNGNVVNQNNSYGADSDIKLKENIVDAPSQWDDIKAVSVRKYSLKSDNLDEPNMLGVIAQELESSGMNGLVKEIADIDKDMNDLGTTTKTVNYSILYMKAVKALQEAMTRIETLETKVAALEG